MKVKAIAKYEWTASLYIQALLKVNFICIRYSNFNDASLVSCTFLISY